MKLEKRQLGSTGFQATVLGIGDLADRSVPLEKCVATIHRAMDFGLNLIDTAPGYEDGYSEAIVGAALRGRREGMFVIDKIDHLDQPVGHRWREAFKPWAWTWWICLSFMRFLSWRGGRSLPDPVAAWSSLGRL